MGLIDFIRAKKYALLSLFWCFICLYSFKIGNRIISCVAVVMFCLSALMWFNDRNARKAAAKNAKSGKSFSSKKKK